ncbi:uncharacterized protein K02A2.6-like [Tachysurus ichikawai]
MSPQGRLYYLTTLEMKAMNNHLQRFLVFANIYPGLKFHQGLKFQLLLTYISSLPPCKHLSGPLRPNVPLPDSINCLPVYPDPAIYHSLKSSIGAIAPGCSVNPALPAPYQSSSSTSGGHYLRRLSGTSCQPVWFALSRRHPGPLQAAFLNSFFVPRHPWSHISMDFVTCLPLSAGHTTIISVVEQFFKILVSPCSSTFLASMASHTTSSLTEAPS